MGLEEAQAIVGPLTPGKLIGLEVILDAQDAKKSLTLVSDMNAGVVGGKPSKKYLEHVVDRAGRVEEIRNLKPGEKPRPLGEPRTSTPEEIALFRSQLMRADATRTKGPTPA